MAENYSGLFLNPGWPSRSLNDSTSRGNLGVPIFTIDPDYGVKAYKYVLFNATGTAGTAYAFTDLYGREVSSTFTGCLNRPAGVAVATVTSGNYGLVQCYGYYATILTDAGDDFADDDSIILKTAGTTDRIAAGTAPTYKRLGVAVAADVDAADTVAGWLDCVW